MELLASSIELIARWDVMAALLIGSIGGVIVGGLPGVGAAVAIAIVLPVTFALEPIVGLTALLGIYGSSMFGGAIPAILVNTPGTPVNALTTYDGYPMTQRGEARRALSLAYSASFFGALFSIVALMLLAPVLAKVAPMFGAREIFLAALLGILLVDHHPPGSGACRRDAGLRRHLPADHRHREHRLHPTLYLRHGLAAVGH